MATNLSDLPPTVRDFRPLCPGCTPARMVEAGVRPCSFYDCPGLPPELQVTCDTCMYDFAAGDGQVQCDHSSCPTAIRLSGNVETYRRWVEMIVEEAHLIEAG